jgi:hypothetical protein
MKIKIRHLILKQLFFLLPLFAITSASAQEMATALTGVNFRSSPNGDIITAIPKGEYVKVLGKSGNWTIVQTSKGKKGYIYSKYLSSQPNGEAEGGFCAVCKSGGYVTAGQDTHDNAQKVMDMVNPVGGPAACITRKIENALMSRWRSTYGSREKGKGKCGIAIRRGLNVAGVWSGGGIGHAKDMMPGLKKMGFVNLKDKYPNITPDSAPAGTILVYGAAAARNRRYCKGQGTTYGHIEYKQSQKPKKYLYDGRPNFSIQEAYGASCRPLIGVMQMTNDCPTCTKALKNACGA